ncbi:MAG: phospholipid carrier-dependent glycosyltransferase, partial [Burkholderiales bacterium]|nr:phospholipid carrier-dependent glycosyltransferase [Anaerolineae bacterium]
MSDRVLHTVSRVILIAAALLLLGYFVVYVVYAVNLMHFPFDYDQGEGFELVDTLMFSRGEWPYQDTEVYPFYSSNYPPLFHVLLVPFAWVFGPAYWYGRLLGFLGTLICAAAVSYAVYREGRNRWLALLAGLAFLASNTVYHIGPLFRQHMTMVMFETLAVVVLARAFDPAETTSQQRRRLLIGFALLLAAGY